MGNGKAPHRVRNVLVVVAITVVAGWLQRLPVWLVCIVGAPVAYVAWRWGERIAIAVRAGFAAFKGRETGPEPEPTGAAEIRNHKLERLHRADGRIGQFERDARQHAEIPDHWRIKVFHEWYKSTLAFIESCVDLEDHWEWLEEFEELGESEEEDGARVRHLFEAGDEHLAKLRQRLTLGDIRDDWDGR